MPDDEEKAIARESAMLRTLQNKEFRRRFFKSFLLTLAAFSVPITIQYGYIVGEFQPAHLLAPGAFALCMAGILGWNAILRAKLERSNGIKNEFISGVSHELRTPLTVIIGHSRLLSASEALATDEREQAASIFRSGEYLLRIVNDLLDMAHIESGRMVFDIGQPPLHEAYGRSTALLSHEAKKRAIRFAIEPFDESLKVSADPLRLQQILVNLLSNAIKFGDADSAVRIITEPKEGSVRVSIADQGPGMSCVQMEQLFEPFYRAVADPNKFRGTGIGLAISKHLVESMGGKIGAACAEGQGCRFWYELPLATKTVG